MAIAEPAQATELTTLAPEPPREHAVEVEKGWFFSRAVSTELTKPPPAPTPPTTTSNNKERIAVLSQALNAGALSQAVATVDDEHPIDDFKPHVLHQTHELFRACFRFVAASQADLRLAAIAMVNRRPHGRALCPRCRFSYLLTRLPLQCLDTKMFEFLKVRSSHAGLARR